MQAKILSILYSTQGKDGLWYTGIKTSTGGFIGTFKVCSEKEVKVGDMVPFELLEKLAPRG